MTPPTNSAAISRIVAIGREMNGSEIDLTTPGLQRWRPSRCRRLQDRSRPLLRRRHRLGGDPDVRSQLELAGGHDFLAGFEPGADQGGAGLALEDRYRPRLDPRVAADDIDEAAAGARLHRRQRHRDAVPDGLQHEMGGDELA